MTAGPQPRGIDEALVEKAAEVLRDWQHGLPVEARRTFGPTVLASAEDFARVVLAAVWDDLAAAVADARPAPAAQPAVDVLDVINLYVECRDAHGQTHDQAIATVLQTERDAALPTDDDPYERGVQDGQREKFSAVHGWIEDARADERRKALEEAEAIALRCADTTEDFIKDKGCRWVAREIAAARAAGSAHTADTARDEGDGDG